MYAGQWLSKQRPNFDAGYRRGQAPHLEQLEDRTAFNASPLLVPVNVGYLNAVSEAGTLAVVADSAGNFYFTQSPSIGSAGNFSSPSIASTFRANVVIFSPTVFAPNGQLLWAAPEFDDSIPLGAVSVAPEIPFGLATLDYPLPARAPNVQLLWAGPQAGESIRVSAVSVAPEIPFGPATLDYLLPPPPNHTSVPTLAKPGVLATLANAGDELFRTHPFLNAENRSDASRGIPLVLQSPLATSVPANEDLPSELRPWLAQPELTPLAAVFLEPPATDATCEWSQPYPSTVPVRPPSSASSPVQTAAPGREDTVRTSATEVESTLVPSIRTAADEESLASKWLTRGAATSLLLLLYRRLFALWRNRQSPAIACQDTPSKDLAARSPGVPPVPALGLFRCQ